MKNYNSTNKRNSFYISKSQKVKYISIEDIIKTAIINSKHQKRETNKKLPTIK